MKIFNLEATFKRNRLGYWNSCKRLPNFVNVAALVVGTQKNCLNETVLLSTQNMLKNIGKKIFTTLR